MYFDNRKVYIELSASKSNIRKAYDHKDNNLIILSKEQNPSRASLWPHAESS